MATYATLDDLGAYLGTEPPAGAQKMLVDASARVDAVLVSSAWTTDGAGLPTAAAVIAGFKTAVCQQVEWWINNGTSADEDLAGWTSYSLNGQSVARDPNYIKRRSRLCDKAFDTLRLVTTGTPFTTALLPGKPSI